MLTVFSNDSKFRKVCLATGVSLLVFFFVMSSTSTLTVLGIWMKLTVLRAVGSIITSVGAAVLAALIMKLILTRNASGTGQLYCRFRAAPVLPIETPLIIVTALALVRSVALLNNWLTGFLNIPGTAALEINPGGGLVLNMIAIALVPGFFEEFFFRGFICNNLRRFGSVRAVLISSCFFSLMHGNLDQLLYTFAAGLILGWCFIKTGSVWLGIMIHVSNNAVSVLLGYVQDQMGPSAAVTGNVILFIAGFVSILVLAVIWFWKFRLKKKERVAEPDLMEWTLTGPLDAFEDRIRPSRTLRHVFNLPTVCFLVLIVGNIILTLLYGKMLYG
ncbi:MAG: CPBP family intramembrane metalloprotease [Clostridia bacterium]|nr:CPBP family intramembrane metalloprotease [Clostridia bacterium]